MSHIRGLDGLRAIAIVVVMGFHGAVPGFAAGFAGVDVFFVLSGFLITSLLVSEFSRNSRIHLRHFWMRRALRLLPALFATIVGVLAIVTVQKVAIGFSSETVLSTVYTIPFTLLYSTNIMRALGINGNGGLLAHSWSLSVEEQFYLFWPLLVGWVLVRKQASDLLKWALALFLGSAGLAAVATVLGADLFVVENLTFTRAFGMFLGSALAVALHLGKLDRLQSIARHPAVPIAAAATIGALVTFGAYGDRWMFVCGLQAVVVATAVLILHVMSDQHGRIVGILEHRVPVAVGRRSYGLYLYHYPLFTAAGAEGLGIKLGVAVVATFAAAWLSFRFIESPALDLRHRYPS